MKRFQILPEALKDAIFSEKTSDAISKSCTLRDASGDKTPLIGQLTTRILLGYLRPELFALEIQKETGIDIQKAQLVAHDLDMEIFSAVRLELKKLYPPTIQTPTVQSWMAQKPELRSTDYEVRKTDAPAPAAKPRYVIPIPERFLNPETRNIKLETQDRKPTNQSGEVGFPTTGTPDNSTPVPQRQITQTATESQGAEARPLSEGGHRISTDGSQGVEARPPEEKSNVLRPDLQQPINEPTPVSSSKTNSADENLKSEGGGQVSTEARPQSPPITPPPYFKPIVPLPTFIQTQFRTTQVNTQKTEQSPKDSSSPNSALADDPQIKSIISKFSVSSTQKPKPPQESPYKEKI